MESTDNSRLSHPRKPYYWPEPGGKGGGLEARRVVRLRTDPVGGIDGRTQGTIRFPGTAGATLLSFAALQDTWFRIYASAADREADRLRGIDSFPPTTPIIFDGLVKGGLLAGQLDRTLWAAGPGCDNEGAFSGSTDGDGTTFWATDIYLGTGHPTAADMVVGSTYSVDYGTLVTVGSIAIRNGTGALAIPKSFSVEASNNGTTWRMIVPEYIPTDTQTDVLVNFSTPFQCRYMRLVAVTVNPTPGPWAIREFTAYASAADQLIMRLWNGDEAGIPCFNWDDFSKDQFYYSAQVDPDHVYNIFIQAFGYRSCDLYSWSVDGTGRLVVTLAESHTEDCILTGELPPLSGEVEYIDPNDIRPRYFNIGSELRAFGTGGIVKITTKPPTQQAATATMIFTRSSAVDTGTFQAGLVYYVTDAGDFNSGSYLKAGIARSGSTAIHAFIGWQDAEGVNHTLVSGSDFGCGLSQGGVLTTAVGTDVDDNVTVFCYLNDVLQCSAAVPTALLDTAPSHSYVGFFNDASDPPGSPLAWGGVGINSIQVAGGTGQAIVDIGYVPMEIPGGTLKRPAFDQKSTELT